MYTSARQPPPKLGSSTLRLEVIDAMALWKGIETSDIQEAVSLAIIAAGNFLATNGLVAKAWSERRGKECVADHAALGNRFREEETRFLAAPDNRQPTPEEREANARMFADLARKLARGQA